MRVHSKPIIDKFVRKHPDAKSSIESWYNETIEANWKTTMDIKNRYASASFLKRNYVIFNIKGNDYRLVVKVAYNTGVVFIKWIGTHSEYSKNKFP